MFDKFAIGHISLISASTPHHWRSAKSQKAASQTRQFFTQDKTMVSTRTKLLIRKKQIAPPAPTPLEIERVPLVCGNAPRFAWLVRFFAGGCLSESQPVQVRD
ncbi:hypothetical protein [Novosphingobium sp. PhB57]|uniref:hypothetical protein n=1 Tax=Novosphingobium sp. PhB57 TaxID=2485107 RepID=UPI001045CBEE|nr:hypothetical protein [Novosphingobium sp. PhB57]